MRTIEREKLVTSELSHLEVRMRRAAAARPAAAGGEPQVEYRSRNNIRAIATAQDGSRIADVGIGVHDSELREAKTSQHRVGRFIPKTEKHIELAVLYERSKEHHEPYANNVLLPIGMDEKVSRNASRYVGLAHPEIPAVHAYVTDDFAAGSQSRDVRKRRPFREGPVAPIPDGAVILPSLARPSSVLPEKVDDFVTHIDRVHTLKVK
jgi:hypothetical protein